MKKILFTLLLVVGGFVAQAQNTITVRYFVQDGANYAVAYAEDDNEQCIDNAVEQIFTFNTTTNVLTIDGSAVPAFTNQTDITYWTNVFAGSSLLVVPVNANQIPTAGFVQGVTFN